MKKHDLTSKVMRRVAGFEKRRSYVWIVRSLIVVVGALGLSFILLMSSGQELAQQNTFDLLSLFSEDSEIIRDYWRDTLNIFWLELPKEKILLGFIFLIAAVLFLFVFRKKLKSVIEKLKVLAKY